MEISNLYLRVDEEIKLRDQYSTFIARKIGIGTLNILSGKIVACDPFMISQDDHPFHQEIAIGEYKVSIIIALNLANRDERIAAAIIEFSSILPKRWAMATKGSQDLSQLRENHIYGYGVDSGTGSFVDFKTAHILVQNFMRNDNYFNELIEHFDKNYVATRSWMIYQVDPEKKLNIAMFSAGYGDGYYPSYWGYATDSSIVCLVTDFGVLGSAEPIK